MPDATIRFLGQEVPVTEVEIVEMNEAVNTYKLSDGTKLLVRVAVTGVARIDGQFDGEGNPVYYVRNGIITTPSNVPANLRRPQ